MPFMPHEIHNLLKSKILNPTHPACDVVATFHRGLI